MTYQFTAFFEELGITRGWQNNKQVPPPEVDKWVNMLGERIQDKLSSIVIFPYHYMLSQIPWLDQS
jgi:hypothetical protein